MSSAQKVQESDTTGNDRFIEVCYALNNDLKKCGSKFLMNLKEVRKIIFKSSLTPAQRIYSASQ